MADIEQEALNALKASFNSLMPVSADPHDTPQVIVVPLKVTPIGLGGFIGVNSDPTGEIHGRRIEANIKLNLKANNQEDLADATNTVMTSLMGAGRAELSQLGIFKITPHPLESAHDAGRSSVGQDITFTVLFEYLKPPEAGEDIISTIPLNIVTDRET